MADVVIIEEEDGNGRHEILGKWEASPDECPACGEYTDCFIYQDDGVDYVGAERCTNCEYVDKFIDPDELAKLDF